VRWVLSPSPAMTHCAALLMTSTPVLWGTLQQTSVNLHGTAPCWQLFAVPYGLYTLVCCAGCLLGASPDLVQRQAGEHTQQTP
jgi:hypothetical protein